MSTHLDRRGFLGVMASAVAVSGLRFEMPRVDKIGVQLYTLREEATADIDRVLAALAEIGYEEVELFGLFVNGGRELRAKLDAVGLRAASGHVSLEAVRRNWEATLEMAQELGQRLIVVPSLPSDARSPDGLRRAAEDLTRGGEVARAAGLRLGFHNHDWEMRPLENGERPIDVILENSDPDYVDWQMDIFWTVHGGADPLAELERYNGRVTSVHVKDRSADGDMVDVGAGVIDFATVLERADAQGLMHQFVEHDRPGDAIESVRKSFNALREIIG